MNNVAVVPQNAAVSNLVKVKLRDYAQLFKLRLTSLVVFSTAMGYLGASGGAIDWLALVCLLAGGFMTVCSANAINQIIEREVDRRMRRTESRPLAQNRMQVGEATVLSLLTGIAGVSIVGYTLNPLSGFLSLLSLFLYAFAYTPLKKVSPIAVYIGAIPGALPPLIGYAAFDGSIDTLGWMFFLVQVVWQLPHFWAIAWLLDDDYRKVGYYLLPLRNGKSKASSFIIFLTTAFLLPLCAWMAMGSVLSIAAVLAIALLSAFFFGQSVALLYRRDDASARRLMFGSFAYLPLVQIIMAVG